MATTVYQNIGASDYGLATTTHTNPAGLKITIPTLAIVTKASAAAKDGSSSHNFFISIYNDSAGTRGTLIANSSNSSTLNTVYSFRDVTYTPVITLAPGTYWLQTSEGTGNPGATSLAFDTGGAANSGFSTSDIGTITYDTNQYSMNLTYQPVGFNIALV